MYGQLLVLVLQPCCSCSLSCAHVIGWNCILMSEINNNNNNNKSERLQLLWTYQHQTRIMSIDCQYFDLIQRLHKNILSHYLHRSSWRRGRVSDLRPEVVGSSFGRATLGKFLCLCLGTGEASE